MSGLDLLRQLPLFIGLSEPDLQQLYAMAEQMTLAAGETLMEEGSVGNSLYVALDGKFDVTKRSGERELLIACRGPGDIFGEISLLEETPRTATVRAAGPAHLLCISRSAFKQLLAWSPDAALTILRTVAERLRNTELMLHHNEKMAALGTLSAGLAHELNNPAAAAARSSALLGAAMARLQETASELERLDLPPAARELIANLRRELFSRKPDTAGLDALALSDREAEIELWLEEVGAADAWETAAEIVAFGWTLGELTSITSGLTPEQSLCFVDWFGAACTAYTLLDEVNRGTQRISEIVNSVKSYSHLDQAPVQLIDLHQGLEDTLLILRHKLGQGIKILRDYAPDLPRIEAYAGELNQVWTSLLDNAIDATQGRGEIRIHTYLQGDDVVIEVTDNGPGIPPEVQDRIFEAFYTTKGVGEGTGLGLHISYNVVVNQHRGQITVQSRPGETTFRVTLPVQLARRQDA